MFTATVGHRLSNEAAALVSGTVELKVKDPCVSVQSSHPQVLKVARKITVTERKEVINEWSPFRPHQNAPWILY